MYSISLIRAELFKSYGYLICFYLFPYLGRKSPSRDSQSSERPCSVAPLYNPPDLVPTNDPLPHASSPGPQPSPVNPQLPALRGAVNQRYGYSCSSWRYN